MKFSKLMKEIKCFPDVHLAARQVQLDILFAKEIRKRRKTEHRARTLDLKFFISLLKKISVLRYPPTEIFIPKSVKTVNSVNENIVLSVVPTSEEKEFERKEMKQKQKTDLSHSFSKLDAKSAGLKKPSQGVTLALINELSSGKKKNFLTNHKSSILPGMKNNLRKNGKKIENPSMLDLVLSVEDYESDEENLDFKHVSYAYGKLISECLVSSDLFSTAVWDELKLVTMKKEGRRFCASARIQSTIRKHLARKKYRNFLRQLILLQNGFRRNRVLAKIRIIRNGLYDDWLLRMRYRASVSITSIARMFLVRCWITRIKREYLQEQMESSAANRARLAAEQKKRRIARIFVECRRVSGFDVVVEISRTDNKRHSRDYGVYVDVYLPLTQARTR